MINEMVREKPSSPDVLSDAIATAFRKAAAVSPVKPFLLVGNKVLTYGDLLDRVGRLASLFEKSGMLTGDRLIIATRDDEEAIVLFLASLRCGIAAIMLDPQAPAPSAQALINESSAKGIVLDEALHEKWRPAAHPFVLKINKASRPNKLFDKLLRKKRIPADGEDSYPAILEKIPPGSPSYEVSPALDAYIIFTSGTTSRPKGVQISRFSLSLHLDTLARHFGYDTGSRILNILPLHHADGLVQGPLAAFWNCACVSRPMPFSIPHIPLLLDKVYSERITHFVTVPTILSMILQFSQGYKDSFATEDFRFIISAAAKLEEHLWETFERRFGTKIANVYGLTETVTGGLFCGPDDKSRKLGSIGRPVDCEARIVDDYGCEIPDGETGELIMRGRNIMKGYLDDPAATAAILHDGWLYTGDLAIRDSDGFYRIAGRKKNLIITGGVNVLPDEVTEVLNSHHGVIEAVTFGRQDNTWGELVVSCVVTNGNGIGEIQLIDFCRSQLPPEKVPSRIHLLPLLPKGPSGKVIIAEVRRLADDEPLINTGADEADIENSMLNLAARCFKVPAESLSRGSRQTNTPGWDSLAHLEFAVAIEKTFGVRLDPLDIIRIESLNDALVIVDGKRRIG